MALPALEAMPQTAVASQTSELPKRMAFVFVPNGVNLAHWTPQATGFDYDLPKILSTHTSSFSDRSGLRIFGRS